MLASGDLASTSLMVSMIVAGVAIALGLVQWSEFRNRDDDLTEADARDFLRRDWRRGVGVVLMLLLALGNYVGSRIPPLIDTEFPYELEVRQSVRAFPEPGSRPGSAGMPIRSSSRSGSRSSSCS